MKSRSILRKVFGIKTLMFLCLFLFPLISFSQGKRAKVLEKYEFATVNVTKRASIDSAFQEYARFTGDGDICIYKDSIIISWSNEWESGHYSMYVDTIANYTIDNGQRTGQTRLFTVTSKGYHDVSGAFMLIEGTDENGPFLDALLDTQFNESGHPEIRRIYMGIERLK